MITIYIYVWLAVLILCIIVEAATANLATIWFIPSALAAMIFAACDLPLWSQITVFIGLGVVLLVTTKPLFEKLLKARPTEKTNTDTIIGKLAPVIEEIDNLREIGAVKIEGKVWSARNVETNDVIPVGALVEIKSIEITEVRTDATTYNTVKLTDNGVSVNHILADGSKLVT